MRCGGSRTEEGEGSLAGSPQQRGSRPRLAWLLRGPGAIPPACGEVEAAAEARRRPMGASPPPLLPPPPPSPQRQKLAPSRPRAHPQSSLRPPLARPGPPRLPFRRRAAGPRPVSRLLCCSRPFFPGLAGLALGSAGLGGRREEEEGGRERAGGRAEGGGEERAEPVRRGPGARTRGETAQRLPAGPAPRRRRRRRDAPDLT